MSVYKYFLLSDQTKETIGRVEADGIYEAMKKSARKKQLKLTEFLEIFNVEKII
jgi:hypothetical protein